MDCRLLGCGVASVGDDFRVMAPVNPRRGVESHGIAVEALADILDGQLGEGWAWRVDLGFYFRKNDVAPKARAASWRIRRFNGLGPRRFRRHKFCKRRGDCIARGADSSRVIMPRLHYGRKDKQHFVVKIHVAYNYSTAIVEINRCGQIVARQATREGEVNGG